MYNKKGEKKTRLSNKIVSILLSVTYTITLTTWCIQNGRLKCQTGSDTYFHTSVLAYWKNNTLVYIVLNLLNLSSIQITLRCLSHYQGDDDIVLSVVIFGDLLNYLILIGSSWK